MMKAGSAREAMPVSMANANTNGIEAGNGNGMNDDGNNGNEGGEGNQQGERDNNGEEDPNGNDLEGEGEGSERFEDTFERRQHVAIAVLYHAYAQLVVHEATSAQDDDDDDNEDASMAVTDGEEQTRVYDSLLLSLLRGLRARCVAYRSSLC